MTQFVAVWPDGISVRWRSLGWGEFRHFRMLLQQGGGGVSIEIYKSVLLDGPAIEAAPAGVVVFIAQHVMQNNPFSGDYKALAAGLVDGRSEVKSRYLLTARALVSHIFNYSFEDIDKWDSDIFMRRLAMAEFITGKPLDPVNPEDKDKKAANKLPKIRPLTPGQAAVIDRVRNRGRA
jgi:hypothetical protein